MSWSTTYDASAGTYDKVWVENEPTIQDHRPLEEVQSEKLSELSSACESAIFQGITLTTEDGVERHFACKIVDQLNTSAALALVNQGATGWLFQDEESNCFYATANDIRRISAWFVEHITKTRTYHNTLKKYVKTLTTSEQVLAVQWGQELTGEWLEQYNEKLAQAAASVGGGGNAGG